MRKKIKKTQVKWHSNSGTVYVKNMDSLHLLNAIHCIERNHHLFGYDIPYQYPHMVEEARNRHILPR